MVGYVNTMQKAAGFGLPRFPRRMDWIIASVKQDWSIGSP